MLQAMALKGGAESVGWLLQKNAEVSKADVEMIEGVLQSCKEVYGENPESRPEPLTLYPDVCEKFGQEAISHALDLIKNKLRGDGKQVSHSGKRYLPHRAGHTL